MCWFRNSNNFGWGSALLDATFSQCFPRLRLTITGLTRSPLLRHPTTHGFQFLYTYIYLRNTVYLYRIWKCCWWFEPLLMRSLAGRPQRIWRWSLQLGSGCSISGGFPKLVTPKLDGFIWLETQQCFRGCLGVVLRIPNLWDGNPCDITDDPSAFWSLEGVGLSTL